MVKKALWLILLVAVSFASRAASPLTVPSAVKEYDASVIRVVDGDTLRVKDQNGLVHKIRFANIDAPEMNQAYGQKSKAALADVERQKVVIQVWYRDRYKREVADIFYRGKDLGLRQVEAGNAWVYSYYAKRFLPPARYARYAAAEENARTRHLGLWQEAAPTAPWVFRRKAR